MGKVIFAIILLILTGCNINNIPKEELQNINETENDVIVIPGSSNPDHIKENISIFDFELTEEEMKQIEGLNRDEKHDWY